MTSTCKTFEVKKEPESWNVDDDRIQLLRLNKDLLSNTVISKDNVKICERMLVQGRELVLRKLANRIDSQENENCIQRLIQLEISLHLFHARITPKILAELHDKKKSRTIKKMPLFDVEKADNGVKIIEAKKSYAIFESEESTPGPSRSPEDGRFLTWTPARPGPKCDFTSDIPLETSHSELFEKPPNSANLEYGHLNMTTKVTKNTVSPKTEENMKLLEKSLNEIEVTRSNLQECKQLASYAQKLLDIIPDLLGKWSRDVRNLYYDCKTCKANLDRDIAFVLGANVARIRAREMITSQHDMGFSCRDLTLLKKIASASLLVREDNLEVCEDWVRFGREVKKVAPAKLANLNERHLRCYNDCIWKIEMLEQNIMLFKKNPRYPNLPDDGNCHSRQLWLSRKLMVRHVPGDERPSQEEHPRKRLRIEVKERPK